MNKIPKHIGFIMDGNRRWANKNKLKIFFGHKKGTDIIEPIVNYASDIGVKYVSFWAFSSENWKRWEEVTVLMDVFRATLKEGWLKRLMEEGVRITTIGDLSQFPEDIRSDVERIKEETKNNTKIELIFALNYGGRNEIVRAVNKVISEAKDSINEEEFGSYLYTAEIDDPDMIIRTGGEKRLSGYMPYQSVYSELFFVDTLWPDFGVSELKNLIQEFQNRDRRYGK